MISIVNKYALVAIIMWMAAMMTSCVTNDKSADIVTQTPDSVTTLSYAKHFSLEHYHNYTVAIVLNPWDSGTVLGKYFLVKDKSINVPSDGVKVLTPVTNAAATSCCHVAFINNLGCVNNIKGVCNPELMYCSAIKEAVTQGLCSDLGDSFSINFEATLMQQPGVLFATSYNQPDQHILRVKEAGVPVVSTVEWIEPDILGRAEWIKFIAAFFGKEHEADSIFTSVVTEFNSLKAEAKNYTDHPSILPGLSYKGTWYMPAGKSYMAQLFADAGGDYFLKNDSTEGSIPLSFEYVIKNFSNADIWIGLDFNTYNELIRTDNRLSVLKPYITRNAFNNNKRTNGVGGNDFWENGVVHPEWLLKDLITVLHKENAADIQSTAFIQPLK